MSIRNTIGLPKGAITLNAGLVTECAVEVVSSVTDGSVELESLGGAEEDRLVTKAAFTRGTLDLGGSTSANVIVGGVNRGIVVTGNASNIRMTGSEVWVNGRRIDMDDFPGTPKMGKGIKAKVRIPEGSSLTIRGCGKVLFGLQERELAILTIEATKDVYSDVPATRRMSVQAASGDVRIDELPMHADIVVSTGDAKLGMVKPLSTLSVRAASGDVTVYDQTRGQVQGTFQVASGDLKIVSVTDEEEPSSPGPLGRWISNLIS